MKHSCCEDVCGLKSCTYVKILSLTLAKDFKLVVGHSSRQTSKCRNFSPEYEHKNIWKVCQHQLVRQRDTHSERHFNVISISRGTTTANTRVTKVTLWSLTSGGIQKTCRYERAGWAEGYQSNLWEAPTTKAAAKVNGCHREEKRF